MGPSGFFLPGTRDYLPLGDVNPLNRSAPGVGLLALPSNGTDEDGWPG
jgi:hypothetical protein